MLENENRPQPEGQKDSDAYSKEQEDSLVRRLIERLKAEQSLDANQTQDTSIPETLRTDTDTDAHTDTGSDTHTNSVSSTHTNTNVKEPNAVVEKIQDAAPEASEPPMSENARRLAARRKALQQNTDDLRDTDQRDVESRGQKERRRRKRIHISRKMKLLLLVGLLLFGISFAITTWLLHLPNPERDVPRSVIRAIFSTKYMESAEIWGPLLSEETKRRSMNKLNTRIRPHMTKECYKKLETMGLIGTVHKLAYVSECNMVFASFEPVTTDKVPSNLYPNSKVQSYRVAIDQVDVVNKTLKQTFTFVVTITIGYHEKELIIEDISFDDESKLPVKPKRFP